MPITLSVLTIMALAVLVVPLILWLMKFSACYALNIKAWGPEALEALGKPMKKYMSLFLKVNIRHYINTAGYKFYLEQDSTTKRWVFRESSYYIGARYQLVSSYSEAISFATKAEALREAGVETNLSNKIPRAWALWAIPLAIITDSCLMAFFHSPVATISIICTVSTIQSTRWLSGKVAGNVKHTQSNTSRIDELEKQKDE